MLQKKKTHAFKINISFPRWIWPSKDFTFLFRILGIFFTQAKEAVTGEAPMGKVTSLCTHILKTTTIERQENMRYIFNKPTKRFEVFFLLHTNCNCTCLPSVPFDQLLLIIDNCRFKWDLMSSFSSSLGASLFSLR